MAHKHHSSSASAANTTTNIDELSIDEITRRVEATMEHIQGIRTLWPGVVRLTSDERRTIPKQLASAAMFDALHAIFNVVDMIPDVFAPLGDQDDGRDPNKFETDLLRCRLARIRSQEKVRDALTELAQDIADDVLHTGRKVMTPGMLAFRVAKGLAEGNPKVKAALAPALDIFSAMTRRARKGKAAKKAGVNGGASATASENL